MPKDPHDEGWPAAVGRVQVASLALWVSGERHVGATVRAAENLLDAAKVVQMRLAFEQIVADGSADVAAVRGWERVLRSAMSTPSTVARLGCSAGCATFVPHRAPRCWADRDLGLYQMEAATVWLNPFLGLLSIGLGSITH